jgi:glycosyltransferase involved in cell wall biosynthesis
MTSRRLSILHLSQLPASPPRFGAQARIHGLLAPLAARHEVTAIALMDPEFDEDECRRAMAQYCREVVLIPNPHGRGVWAKRALQLRSLVSTHSFEHLRYAVPAFQAELDRLQQRTRFDVVDLEFPYLAHFRMRQSPAGAPRPKVVIDAHEIAHDMVRQFARAGLGRGQALYGELDWRKLRREELAAFRAADGIYLCSADDETRVHAELPGARTAVVPNAADVEFYRPRPADPPADGRTIVFFGLLSTRPNIDGVTWLVEEIWPRVARARPEARLRIFGKNPPPAVLALVRPGVEVVGFVEDLRPHLASAAAVAVPLRLGGGTRLKIVEAMAMAKAIVSTRLGAEGIEARPEREILLADDPVAFAASLVRLLEDPAAAVRLGGAARHLAVERYAWSSSAATLEQFLLETVDRTQRPAAPAPVERTG